MKKWLLVFSMALTGCATPLVYAPAPAEAVSMQTAAVASGVLEPQHFYFTLISQYKSGSARVLVLTDPAIKLADLTVSANQITVHDRAPQVSSNLILAWGKLVQEEFLTPCPARKIARQAAPIKGTFELDVKGGVCL